MVWISEYQRWLSESESLNNAQMVVNHFVGSDWTKESLSALCGNMRHESSINPDMYEYGYSWGADRGFGLVQWTPRSKYWDWAVANGLSPRSGDSQLARIDYEVENNIQWIAQSHIFNGLTFKEFRTNSKGLSVNQLTEAFMRGYERPASYSSLPDRQRFARLCMERLDFTGTGEGGGGGKPAFPTTPGLEISSPYGWRIHPVYGDYRFHGAIDISGGGVERPIYATQTGVVIQNSFSETGGWTIVLEHTGDRYYSRYLHLARQSPMRVGTSVTKGQEIGTMGTTGTSTGIHLDFAIATSADGFGTEERTIDPELYLDMDFGGGTQPQPEQPNKGDDLITLWLTDALNGWKF